MMYFTDIRVHLLEWVTITPVSQGKNCFWYLLEISHTFPAIKCVTMYIPKLHYFNYIAKPACLEYLSKPDLAFSLQPGDRAVDSLYL